MHDYSLGINIIVIKKMLNLDSKTVLVEMCSLKRMHSSQTRSLAVRNLCSETKGSLVKSRPCVAGLLALYRVFSPSVSRSGSWILF